MMWILLARHTPIGRAYRQYSVVSEDSAQLIENTILLCNMFDRLEANYDIKISISESEATNVPDVELERRMTAAAGGGDHALGKIYTDHFLCMGAGENQ